MAYIPSVILHARLDAEPLMDSASGQLFTTTGTTPVIASGIRDSALQLTQTSYSELVIGQLLSHFSIGFWLYPINPGAVTTPSNTTVSLNMPVVAKADTFIVPVTNQIIPVNSDFLIYEKTGDDNKNSMAVIITGTTQTGTLVTYQINSPYYAASQWHHFWISFDGVARTLRMFIDGSEVSPTSSATPIGLFPYQLTTGTPTFSINKVAPGYTYSVAGNGGKLDDLVLFNTSITSTDSIRRAANMGVAFLALDSEVAVEEVDQAVIFEDAGTIQINSVFANRGNLYVARSDGKLFRGVRTIWQNRRDFFNVNEKEHFVTSNKSSATGVNIAGGVLTIQNEIIRC